MKTLEEFLNTESGKEAVQAVLAVIRVLPDENNRPADVNPNNRMIDSRDVIRWRDHLEDEFGSLEDAFDDLSEAWEEAADEAGVAHDGPVLEVRDGVEAVRAWAGDMELENQFDRFEDERDLWNTVVNEGEGYGDFMHGVTLVHEDHFEDHARDLAEDTGLIDREASWPHTCIDWEQAANELRMDYTEIEIENETFLYR